MRLSFLPMVSLLVIAGCDGCGKPAAERGPARTPPLVPTFEPPSFETSAAPPDPRLVSDPLWNRAAAQDDIDLAALASREGASGLLQALEAGGEIGRVALYALPFAPDPQLAFRRLGQVALVTRDEAQRLIVDVIQQIALRPLPHEPLDEEGRIACALALLQLASAPQVPPATRALAVSTLRLDAFAATVDPLSIPTRFDAPSPDAR